jgi:hypothetical protein
MRLPLFLAFVLAGLLLGQSHAYAYSQFTHEELIDALWAASIRPLLIARFPQITESDLRRAHAYAYGGCLIQDIGYYPFGKRFFSDLAHYVRSGHFVATMLHDARDADELAFAIGALSHYVGDSIGHSQAINPATGQTFPGLEAKFGPIVTYEDSPTAHVRTEFGFDVAQTNWQRYASRVYRKHTGFRVPRRLLYQAFQETYGIPTRGILGPARSALPSYRWAATTLLPAFLNAEIVLLRNRLPVEDRDPAQAEFLVTILKSEYAAVSPNTYSTPGIRAHLLALVIRVVPKVGRLKVLDVKSPTTETEDLFLRSANDALDTFRELLARVLTDPNGDLPLEDLDLDTGKRVAAGESELVDRTFSKLLMQIVRQNASIGSDLREVLLTYFTDANHALNANFNPKEQRRLAHALDLLRRDPQ